MRINKRRSDEIQPAPATQDERGLLPCPFCGSSHVEVFVQDEDDCANRSAIVRCHSCDAQSAQFVGEKKLIMAASAWNRRTPAVLDEISFWDFDPETGLGDVYKAEYIDGWNAHRTAILQLSDNSYLDTACTGEDEV
ncbi:restriction alleviation protein, Lar family [Dickeya dadantii]|uniref:Lar family restriction alleviation protein n=1 Tax=Dickeya dadantii TaxID=204038 RepID=UPI0014956298|nr:Lar family restriction alleviation protein [Dickeya dadantii]NPE55897.1 restriction alleviation protein, Lar family [Dickeya dadantii]NPE67121.1 restriction alleviation protein, Lar family [Dickeya dadantii]